MSVLPRGLGLKEDQPEHREEFQNEVSEVKTRDFVLQCIIEYMEDHQYAPSVRDLCDMTGLSSTSTVQQHLINLSKEGRIEFNGKRCISVEGYKFGKI